MDNYDLLKNMLSMAVFFQIEAIRERGGPSPEDMKKAQETSDILGERGDVLICGGGKPGEAADQFNRTAHAIAVLSFAPGGVTLFGLTFDAAEQLKRIKEKGLNHEGAKRSEAVAGNKAG